MKTQDEKQVQHAIRVKDEDWNRWKPEADKDRRPVEVWVAVKINELIDALEKEVTREKATHEKATR